MNQFLSVLSSIAFLAGPMLAQTPATTTRSDADEGKALRFEVALTDSAVEHRLTGSDELFLGAVMISLSPVLVPYAKGLPPSLTEFVTLGACFGKDQQTFTFASENMRIPPGVRIYVQAAMLNTQGLQVSQVHSYEHLKGLGIQLGQPGADG